MKQIETDFGWRRNWNYFKESFKIMWKQTIEYKANFYMNIFEVIVLSLINLFVIYVVGFILSDFIFWTIGDFFLLYILTYLIALFGGLFSWGKELGSILLQGHLNIFLTKPINLFMAYINYNLSGWVVISSIARFLIFIGILKFFIIEINNLFLSIVVFILISFFFFIMYQFIESLAFIGKKLPEFLGDKLYWNLYGYLYHFPEPFFNNLKFKFIFLFFPVFIISSLLIPIFRGYEIFEFKLQISILISLIIIFGLGTWFNWYYGLKKYEAFG